MKNIIVVLALILSLNIAHALENENLESIAQGTTDVLESVLDADTVEVFSLHNVTVLTRLELSVEVPWIAKLSIRPEIELQWSR